jgi:hypothetical protein
MIPTLILLGVAVGRWWVVALAAIAWPIVLIGTKVDTGFPFAVESAVLAAINTVAGVAVPKCAMAIVHKFRAHSRET